jgi:hypothetical protein
MHGLRTQENTASGDVWKMSPDDGLITAYCSPLTFVFIIRVTMSLEVWVGFAEKMRSDLKDPGLAVWLVWLSWSEHESLGQGRP